MSIIRSRLDGEDLIRGLIIAMKLLDETNGHNDKKLADRLEVIKERAAQYTNLMYPDD